MIYPAGNRAILKGYQLAFAGSLLLFDHNAVIFICFAVLRRYAVNYGLRFGFFKIFLCGRLYGGVVGYGIFGLQRAPIRVKRYCYGHICAAYFNLFVFYAYGIGFKLAFCGIAAGYVKRIILRVFAAGYVKHDAQRLYRAKVCFAFRIRRHYCTVFIKEFISAAGAFHNGSLFPIPCCIKVERYRACRFVYRGDPVVYGKVPDAYRGFARGQLQAVHILYAAEFNARGLIPRSAFNEQRLAVGPFAIHYCFRSAYELYFQRAFCAVKVRPCGQAQRKFVSAGLYGFRAKHAQRCYFGLLNTFTAIVQPFLGHGGKYVFALLGAKIGMPVLGFKHLFHFCFEVNPGMPPVHIQAGSGYIVIHFIDGFLHIRIVAACFRRIGALQLAQEGLCAHVQLKHKVYYFGVIELFILIAVLFGNCDYVYGAFPAVLRTQHHALRVIIIRARQFYRFIHALRRACLFAISSKMRHAKRKIIFFYRCAWVKPWYLHLFYKAVVVITGAFQHHVADAGIFIAGY